MAKLPLIRGQLSGGLEEVGDPRPGQHDVDDLVRPGCLGDVEGALAGPDERGGRRAGEHEHVERAGTGEESASDFDVLLDALSGPLLQHHHEVGARIAACSVRREMPRSMPSLAVMDCMVSESMYSRIVGARPLPTIGGITAVISRSEPNGASTVALCRRSGWSFTVTSVTSARVPSEPITSWVRS